MCRNWKTAVVAVVAAAWILAVVSCDARELSDGSHSNEPRGAIERERLLVLGDIDPDTPAKRIRHLRPLAEFLEGRLALNGVQRVDVVVARDIDEMSILFADGRVDVFLDSPYPSLVVHQRTDTDISLLRWAKDDAQYWTLLVSGKQSGVTDLSDLLGRVLVMQDPYSTSGYLLPIALLRKEGHALREVSSLRERVAADEIGYFFSRDEENSFELVLSGLAPGAAVSNQDFEELPTELREELTVIARSEPVPRQLVSFRAGLDPTLKIEVESALLDITDEDRLSMAAKDPHNGWTWRFEELTPLHFTALGRLGDTIEWVQP